MAATKPAPAQEEVPAASTGTLYDKMEELKEIVDEAHGEIVNGAGNLRYVEGTLQRAVQLAISIRDVAAAHADAIENHF